LLADCIGGRRALVVTTPTVERLYGRRLRAYLARTGGDAHVAVVGRTEATKQLDGVTDICDLAAARGLERSSPIVAVGGGVCTDLSGLAAALYQRGVPHINVPTTFVGLIDAGIGVKNAVNHGGRKSALGTFHPPENCLLDPGFLDTLPARHRRNGLAESIKLAIVVDATLFALLERSGPAIVDGSARSSPIVLDVIRRSVKGMLGELAPNLFEVDDLRRKVDFGHTFSAYIEMASEHRVLHGEAVAMDVALSTEIAMVVGLLDVADRDRIIALLRRCGLATHYPPVSAEQLWRSLRAIVEHRDGELHLVVPTGIGVCTFLGMDAIDPAVIRVALERLRRNTIQTVTYE
jgi:3-dehydroquinate synthase